MNDLVKKDSEASLFAVANFEHAMKIAEYVSKSEMVPKGLRGKPADILISMEFGRRLGLGEMQALQNIAVVNGKPTLYGDGLLGACQGHHTFKSINEQSIKDDKGNVTGFKCTVVRKGYDEAIVREFTKDDAKKAGLLGRPGPWTNYESRMLQMRARGFALRDAFADILNGFIIEEEAQDMPVKDLTPKRERAAKLLAEVIPVELVSAEKAVEIGKLFAKAKFNEERQIKALKYFNTESVCTLAVEDADKLILMLEGAAA